MLLPLGAGKELRMRTISAFFAKRTDCVAAFLDELPGGGLFVETPIVCDVGEQVRLEIRFPDLPDGLVLHGFVAWRRMAAAWRSALRPGLGVGFADGERGKRDFLLDFCTGEFALLRKQGRRLPVDFRAEVTCDGRVVEGRAKDLSRGGVFVETASPFARDAGVEVNLHFDGGRAPDRFAGRVAWQRGFGPDPGMGVEFRFKSLTRRVQVEKLVNEIETRLGAGRTGGASPERSRFRAR
jgi:uncharacterized protein (TIGR02266 family)